MSFASSIDDKPAGKKEFQLKAFLQTNCPIDCLKEQGTVIVLHGYSIQKETMIPWAFLLAEAGFRVVLVAAEFRAGARAYGTRDYVAPCTAPADPFPQGRGIDGTLQRITLSALDGAACKLGTSREELVLSLDRKSPFGGKVKWTRATLDKALRAGLVRAIDDADHRNTIPGFVAAGLKLAAEHAPIDWILGRINIPFLEG